MPDRHNGMYQCAPTYETDSDVLFFFFFSDPRVNDWPMMSSPIPTLLICMSYAYFSKVLGPKMMENRKPFDLRGLLVMYNLVQTLFSSWIFYEVSANKFSINNSNCSLVSSHLRFDTETPDSPIYRWMGSWVFQSFVAKKCSINQFVLSNVIKMTLGV